MTLSKWLWRYNSKQQWGLFIDGHLRAILEKDPADDKRFLLHCHQDVPQVVREILHRMAVQFDFFGLADAGTCEFALPAADIDRLASLADKMGVPLSRTIVTSHPC